MSAADHPWPSAQVKDIAAPTKYALNGGPFGSKLVSRYYTPDGVPVIRGTNLSTDGKFSFDDFVFVSEEKADELLPNNAHPGDLIFTQRGTLGQIGLIPQDCGYERFVVSQSQMKLTVDETKADPLFIYFYFRMPSTIQAIENRTITSGVPHINLQTLREFEIPLPSLDSQRRIAGILSAYDDLIDVNRRRMAVLEEAMHRLYREWFISLRFPGHERTEIVDGVPEGWQKRPLKELCSITLGQSPPSKFYNEDGEGLPFHQGVTDFGNRFVTHTRYCTQLKRIAEPGDILFSVRAPVGRLNVSLDKIVIGRGLSAMRSKIGHQSFLYYQLQSHFHTEDMLGGGAIFASVSKKQLSQERLLTPPIELVEGFEEVSRPVDEQIRNLFKQNQQLAEARNALLPRLMNGSLMV